MFSGHFAVALAGARAARKLPLGPLIVAAFGADILEGVVAAFNVRDMTRVWSHSLPATASIGMVCALWAFALKGTWRDAGVMMLVAVSHTALDFVTAVKTVWPGVPPMGLDLYTRPYLETMIEVGLCIAAWAVWRSALGASRRAAATWAMLALLLVAQVSLLVSVKALGPLTDEDALSKFVR